MHSATPCSPLSPWMTCNSNSIVRRLTCSPCRLFICCYRAPQATRVWLSQRSPALLPACANSLSRGVPPCSMRNHQQATGVIPGRACPSTWLTMSRATAAAVPPTLIAQSRAGLSLGAAQRSPCATIGANAVHMKHQSCPCESSFPHHALT